MNPPDAAPIIFPRLEDDGLTVRVEFCHDSADEAEDLTSISDIASLKAATKVLAVLTVRHWPPESDVQGVREVALEFRQGAIIPSMLQRFAWQRWLTAADAYIRSGGREHSDFELALLPTTAPRRRPGRRGHDADFFPTIAAKYLYLRSQGVRNPVQRIAAEHEYPVSRNTAAGWVKQARELGHLPPGRPGRAG